MSDTSPYYDRSVKIFEKYRTNHMGKKEPCFRAIEDILLSNYSKYVEIRKDVEKGKHHKYFVDKKNPPEKLVKKLKTRISELETVLKQSPPHFTCKHEGCDKKAKYIAIYNLSDYDQRTFDPGRVYCSEEHYQLCPESDKTVSREITFDNLLIRLPIKVSRSEYITNMEILLSNLGMTENELNSKYGLMGGGITPGVISYLRKAEQAKATDDKEKRKERWRNYFKSRKYVIRTLINFFDNKYDKLVLEKKQKPEEKPKDNFTIYIPINSSAKKQPDIDNIPNKNSLQAKILEQQRKRREEKQKEREEKQKEREKQELQDKKDNDEGLEILRNKPMGEWTAEDKRKIWGKKPKKPKKEKEGPSDREQRSLFKIPEN